MSFDGLLNFHASILLKIISLSHVSMLLVIISNKHACGDHFPLDICISIIATLPVSAQADIIRPKLSLVVTLAAGPELDQFVSVSAETMHWWVLLVLLLSAL